MCLATICPQPGIGHVTGWNLQIFKCFSISTSLWHVWQSWLGHSKCMCGHLVMCVLIASLFPLKPHPGTPHAKTTLVHVFWRWILRSFLVPTKSHPLVHLYTTPMILLVIFCDKTMGCVDVPSDSLQHGQVLLCVVHFVIQSRQYP